MYLLLLASCVSPPVRGHHPADADAFLAARASARGDAEAMERVLRAGFSYRKARWALPRETDEDDRRIEALDRAFADGWRMMPAYHEGKLFLATRQYPLAEMCFERVVADFIGCPEAWGLLGHARLMQYCDNLTPGEVQALGIGQPWTPGFQRRAAWLEPPLRGKDRRLWWRAWDALGEAQRQQPDWPWLRAQLALAYLVHPDGAKPDEALRWAKTASGADRITLAVALLAAGRPAEANRLLDRPDPAARYNRAAVLAARGESDRARAQLEAYLREASPLSAWWEIAFETYSRLCKETGRRPGTRKALRSRPPSVAPWVVGAGVRPGDEVAALVERLGPAREGVILAGTNLRRLAFPRCEIEVIATDRVRAVCVKRGAVAIGPARLRPGMKRAEAERLLGSGGVEVVGWSYYPEPGAAIRYDAGGVAEVVLVEVP